PKQHLFDHFVQAFALIILLLLCRKLFWPSRRIINQLGEQNGSTRGNRSLRPVLMYCGRISLGRLLLSARGLSVDRFEGYRHLDEFLAWGRCRHAKPLTVPRKGRFGSNDHG